MSKQNTEKKQKGNEKNNVLSRSVVNNGVVHSNFNGDFFYLEWESQDRKYDIKSERYDQATASHF